MFAIIKTGGKQYIVSPGDKIKVEKLDATEGNEVVFDNLLLVSDKDTLVGTPFVDGYKITAKVLRQGKGEKIIVYKYKPKKRYHKKQGHRQLYTEVEILRIEKGGTSEKKSEAKKVATKPLDAARGKSAADKEAKSAPKQVAKSAAKKKVSTAAKRATKEKASAKAN